LAVPTVCLFDASQLDERGRVTLDAPFDRWCDRLEAISALVVRQLVPSARSTGSDGAKKCAPETARLKSSRRS
jgi:hypothetical protein